MKTLIIDSNYIAHRALHSMGDLEFNEIKTGIIFGFINQIQQLAKKFETNKFIFCWDSTTNKRKEMNSAYKNKAISTLMPDAEYKEHKRRKDEIFNQFTALRLQILPMIGFKNNFVQYGYEGDDMIARTVMAYQNMPFIIVTADEDMYQLLDYAPMYKPMPKTLISKEQFISDYLIAPDQWSKVKAIAGCKSDNVIGMRGIGETKAIQFLTSVMNTKTNTYKRILAEHEHYLYDNLPLVHLPLKGTQTKSIKSDKFDIDEFYRICSHYGLLSLLDKITWWKNFFKGVIYS